MKWYIIIWKDKLVFNNYSILKFLISEWFWVNNLKFSVKKYLEDFRNEISSVEFEKYVHALIHKLSNLNEWH